MRKIIIEPSPQFDGTLNARNTINGLKEPEIADFVKREKRGLGIEELQNKQCEYYDRW
jgi:hypothetical protein